MKTKVKICGIKTVDEAQILNEAKVDFAGLVFAESKRKVGFEAAKKIKKILNPEIKTVGVFVDSNKDEILKLYLEGVIDIAQLHGDYDENFINSLKADSPVEIIKVVRVLENSYNVETAANYVLFDSFSKMGYGGLNKSFDWNIKMKVNVPYFVAGGINETNLKEAIRKLRPYSVDISSGAEENGIKTREKVFNIMKIINEENKWLAQDMANLADNTFPKH